MISLMSSGGLALVAAALGTPVPHRLSDAEAFRSADPRGRPGDPSGEGRHPDDGGPCDARRASSPVISSGTPDERRSHEQDSS